jgi:hypothetical protein
MLLKPTGHTVTTEPTAQVPATLNPSLSPQPTAYSLQSLAHIQSTVYSLYNEKKSTLTQSTGPHTASTAPQHHSTTATHCTTKVPQHHTDHSIIVPQHHSTTAPQHHSITASQQHSTTASRQHITASQHHSNTAPQQHNISQHQHHSTTASQLHSFTDKMRCGAACSCPRACSPSAALSPITSGGMSLTGILQNSSASMARLCG